MKNIGIIGTGYIGLVTALGLAEFGNKVICLDIDEEKIKLLNQGISPIHEEGIEELLNRNIKEKRIYFTTNFQDAVENSEIIFICVNTPSKDDGEVDLSQVISSAKSISKFLKNRKIIAIKSTVPIGTLAKIREIFSKEGKKEGEDYELAVVPEFLREGKAIYDFFNPSRIVIGAEKDYVIKSLKEIFSVFNAPIVVTSPLTAILIKYASNAFLAMRVSFINEIANICDKFSVDVFDVIEGMKYDKRIGGEHLSPGIGFGGPCLTKDLMGLIKMAEKSGYEPDFLRAILEKNEHQVRYIVYKVKDQLSDLLYDYTISIWGLTFKPNTNDVRNSLAIKIINLLKNDGANIKAYDPHGMEEAKKLIKDIKYCNHIYEASKDADLVLILTAWEEFKKVDFLKLKSIMRKPIIIDGVNVLDPQEAKKYGFIYKGVGRE
ncbi:UDP-glucose/GDP-mannose dehydrogenase family protein [Dictyoglomus thermophilum]|uniref:UDP-glucose dehydrogenase family protein n=1 Tax=Dictyoglomus thermophilum TaxID=14 RepID=UPI0011EAC80D|nr:UDP-glucose/GDP-mannose dehydrogenase family protein [Dictyoglomus thermophilum]TYT24037.1 UDP-glucose/GDP-mannose dehydrogenase family protein [Dictyoglomus thermophilum]